VTVPLEEWRFHNNLVVDSARWKHVEFATSFQKREFKRGTKKGVTDK